MLTTAAVCLGVVGWLVWGALTSSQTAAIDDLPTVEEVVVAQAHRHGIDLPELTDEDRDRLSAAPSAASTLSPFDQVRGQLLAVRDTAGVDEALDILAEVATLSDEVAVDCSRLYDEVVAGQSPSRTVSQVCPAGTG